MNNHSAHLDPADFLDLVEGNAMNAAAKVRVDAAIAADPRLARLVEGMQADRAGLMAMSDVRAPANLMGRVEAAMEREALLGLAGEETASGTKIAVSRVEYQRPSVIATIGASRWLRPVAAAAGIALVAGVVFVGVKSVMNRPVKTTEIAKDTSEPGTLDTPVAPTELAHNSPEIMPDAPALNDAAIAMNTDQAPADAAPTKAVSHPFGMPLDRALVLAQEGRLIVRVRASEIAVANDQLMPLIERPNMDRTLARLSGSSLGVVLAAARIPAPAVETPNREYRTPVIAGTDMAPPRRIGMERSPNGEPAAWRQSGEAFALYVQPSQRTLRKTLTDLARGSHVKIVLDEAPESLSDDLGFDPGAILWWASPSTWEKRAAVSVVVETP